MKSINPYLFFENNCREAMTFYQQCLGGELFFMTVAQSPVAAQLPAHMANLVMHASLKHNHIALMASDNCMGEIVAGGKNIISLMLSCSSEEELHSLYNKLAEGGKATVAPKMEFWGDVFGMLTDKFGFNWMLTYNPKEQ